MVMHMRAVQILAGLFMAILLTGCADDASEHAQQFADQAHMTRQRIKVGAFTLTSFWRISDPAQPLFIYIEGDGLAWLSRDVAATDPTPRKALGLALAAEDPAANVVYLARPCQFTPHAMDPNCTSSYWTDKRFAPEVIASVSQAIDYFSTKAPHQKIHLIGYSGGGAVAALVAASRHDIASLRTLAGNLDIEAFNRLHQVSAMPQSLNPASVAPQLADLPQEHFVGDEDRVVPAAIGESYLKAMGNTHCTTLTPIAGATHEEHWLEFWQGAVTRLPACR